MGSSPSWPGRELLLPFLGLQDRMIGRARKFVVEVKAELGKAQWPWDLREKGLKRYKELSDSTIVVVVAMLLLGGYVAVFDLITVSLVGLLTAPW